MNFVWLKEILQDIFVQDQGSTVMVKSHRDNKDY